VRIDGKEVEGWMGALTLVCAPAVTPRGMVVDTAFGSHDGQTWAEIRRAEELERDILSLSS
jgi:flagellar biosynthesis/type III secretory pathway protein FliH